MEYGIRNKKQGARNEEGGIENKVSKTRKRNNKQEIGNKE